MFAQPIVPRVARLDCERVLRMRRIVATMLVLVQVIVPARAAMRVFVAIPVVVVLVRVRVLAQLMHVTVQSAHVMMMTGLRQPK